MHTVIQKIRRNLFRLVLASLLVSVLYATLPRPQSAAAKGTRGLAPETVFSNPANITINSPTSTPAIPIPFAPYPSPIAVSGLTGNITKFTVTLAGINDPRQTNMDVLLVGPTGANLILMSDVGGAAAFNDITLTLDDSAPTIMSGSFGLLGGTYRPTNVGTGDTFPAPAPAGPYNSPAPAGSATLASIFNGTDPTGDWKLYIVQDETNGSPGATGYLANGWSMQITTSGSPATTFANSAGITFDDIVAPATPYPSTIDVSGMTGVISNITVSLNDYSHGRPSDVAVLLVSPNGRGYVIMANVGGTNPVSNLNVTLDDAAALSIPSTITSGTFKPSAIGTTSNFPAPAPPPPYSFGSSPGINSIFGGYSPNGTWSLYVVDNSVGQAGSIAGGWSMNIATAPYVSPNIGCSTANFASSHSYPVGTAPTGMTSADFDGNGKLDLAVANQNSNNISILLNNGTGGFGAATNFTAGSNPYAIATGKFNADAFDDLVVVNGGSNNISILLGDGLGGFGAPTNYSAGPSPISVAVADFNGDGKQDLAVADFGGFFSGTVSVLLGTGTGTFGAPASFGARTQPAFIAAADFNNDGKKDLAVANFGSNNVSILLGTGTGTFTYFSTVLAGSGPVGIAVADTNTDGNLDLAIANYNGNTVTIVRGNGDGTFTPFGTPNGYANPISLDYGDVNSSGGPELAVANSGSNTLTINGDVSLTLDVGLGPYAVVVRDFDGDGRMDLATANNGDDSVTVRLNQCSVADGNRFDFNNDRLTDISVFRPSNTTWYVFFGPSSFTQDIFGAPTDKIVPADYDGDGQTDYATYRPASGVWSIRSRVDLNRPLYYLQFGLPTDIPVPADYDGDGRADLAVFRPSTATWYIRQSTDNALVSVPFGMSGDLPVPGDFDGDHKADVAIFRPADGSWYILQSMSGSVLGVSFGMNGDRPLAVDFDGDGRADIGVYRTGLWYMLQSHDGSFNSAAFGMAGDIPEPGDYDRDGKFDIAVFRPSTGAWYILQSSDGSFATRQWGMNGDTPLPSTNIP